MIINTPITIYSDVNINSFRHFVKKIKLIENILKFNRINNAFIFLKLWTYHT